MRVDRDDAALAAALHELALHDLFRGALERPASVLDQRTDVVGDDRAYEVLAVAGGGDGAARVVGVSAGADDRRIADAAPALVGHPAGGGRSGDIAPGIHRDGAHRPEPLQLVAGRAAALQHAIELLPACRGDEPVVRYALETLEACELFSALA